MAGHVLPLLGCTPEPLGNYLKGLGVFRVVAEQADPLARAWWRGGTLHLSSRFNTQDELRDWFRDEYAPSPLPAPWSVNSGWWPKQKDKGDKRGTANTNLRRLGQSDLPRFQGIRGGIESILTVLGTSTALPETDAGLTDDLRGTLKGLEAQTKKAGVRSRLIRTLRNRVRDRNVVRWLDAIGVTRAGRDEVTSLFALLGDGAAEGVNSFVGNYYGRLCDHLPLNKSDSGYWDSTQGQLSLARIENALFGKLGVQVREADAAGGFYWPSLVEAPNIGQQFISSPKKRAQPWEFILALEGLLVWSAAATRRTESLPGNRISFPFFCDGSVAGSSSLVFKEVPGPESITNGEIWCPLWGRPASIIEVERLFVEGRLIAYQKTATRATQFVVAVASLGLERGIHSFHRVGLIERSGSGDQTTTLAIPLGSWSPDRVGDLLQLREFDDFESSLSQFVQAHANQPRRLLNARRQFEEALFDYARQAVSPDLDDRRPPLLPLLVAGSNVERELKVTCGKVKFKIGQDLTQRLISPIQPLSIPSGTGSSRGTPWLEEDSAEFRIARAVGGITAWGTRTIHGREMPTVESIRANLIPVIRKGESWGWDETTRSAVWSDTASLSRNLAQILTRRLLDAGRGTGDGLPLWSPHGVRFADLLAFWQGEVNERRIGDFIHALAIVDSGRWGPSAIDRRQMQEEPTPYVRAADTWLATPAHQSAEPRELDSQSRWLPASAEWAAGAALPRVYTLLKLCFVGGRLPPRPVDGSPQARTGSEPHPPSCLDVLRLLEAGRLTDAVTIAARRLRAKGYPPILRDSDVLSIVMSQEDCLRLVAMLLLPVEQPGVLAAFSVKPATSPA